VKGFCPYRYNCWLRSSNVLNQWGDHRLYGTLSVSSSSSSPSSSSSSLSPSSFSSCLPGTICLSSWKSINRNFGHTRVSNEMGNLVRGFIDNDNERNGWMISRWSYWIQLDLFWSPPVTTMTKPTTTRINCLPTDAWFRRRILWFLVDSWHDTRDGLEVVRFCLCTVIFYVHWRSTVLTGYKTRGRSIRKSSYTSDGIMAITATTSTACTTSTTSPLRLLNWPTNIAGKTS